jgi:superfamily II DNA or RNA helicase
MASWSRMAEKPSDLGDAGNDERFKLPPMHIRRHQSRVTEIRGLTDGLFADISMSATSLHDVKRQTSSARADTVAGIVHAEPKEARILWCDTDYEADAIKSAVNGALEIRGSMSIEEKEERLEAFASGQILHLIAKPSMCGFGLDWSHCARMAFVGRSYSYETWYQAVRRCWRFGQTKPVNVHLIVAEGESEIGRVIDRKAGDHGKMKSAMREAMLRATAKATEVKVEYNPTHKGRLPKWLAA